jgi:hypothetical protein
METITLSSEQADADVKEAIKKLAAAARVSAAALENEKKAKKALKLAQKLAKEAHKKEQSKDKKVKTPYQIAYKLFGDDLRKNGEKISVQRQGELWKLEDQSVWLLKVKPLAETETRQII